MIEMPRRSVTRFFIPLIDVLILLFGVFLLLPMAAETEHEERFEAATDQAESAEVLERELRRRTLELQKYEELRPALDKVEQMQAELDALRARGKESLQQRVEFKVIDVDPKTGAIVYQDPAHPDRPPVSIGDEPTARGLIERHRREAPGRDLYYYFLYPRPETGYPLASQEFEYRRWFAAVPNSLKGARP